MQRKMETYIDNDSIPKASPGKVVNNMAKLKAGALGEGPHGISEPAGALRELGEHLVRRSIGVIRQGKALQHVN